MLNLFSSDLRQSHPGLSHAALWDRWTGQQACTQAHVFTLGRSQRSGDYARSISCPSFSLYNFTAVTSGIKMCFQVNFTNLHVSFVSLQNEAVILRCVIFFFPETKCLSREGYQHDTENKWPSLTHRWISWGHPQKLG